MSDLQKILEKLDQDVSTLENRWSKVRAQQSHPVATSLNSSLTTSSNSGEMSINLEEVRAAKLDAEAARGEVRLLKKRNKMAVRKIDLALQGLAVIQAQTANGSTAKLVSSSCNQKPSYSQKPPYSQKNREAPEQDDSLNAFQSGTA